VKSSSILTTIFKGVAVMTGLLTRVMLKIPVVGEAMLTSQNKILGKVFPYLSFLGFQRGSSYEIALSNWETYLGLLGGDYEKETVSPGRNVYTFHKCPAGYCRREHLAACEVTMVLDNSLVEASGAKLVVEKCIPTDGMCVEVLLSRDEAV
jgi:hypothetical protein